MLLLILAVASGLFLTKADATVHKYNPRHSFHASLYAAPNVTGVNSTGNVRALSSALRCSSDHVPQLRRAQRT
jgi:hypothetical protein